MVVPQRQKSAYLHQHAQANLLHCKEVTGAVHLYLQSDRWSKALTAFLLYPLDRPHNDQFLTVYLWHVLLLDLLLDAHYN